MRTKQRPVLDEVMDTLKVVINDSLKLFGKDAGGKLNSVKDMKLMKTYKGLKEYIVQLKNPHLTEEEFTMLNRELKHYSYRLESIFAVGDGLFLDVFYIPQMGVAMK